MCEWHRNLLHQWREMRLYLSYPGMCVSGTETCSTSGEMRLYLRCVCEWQPYKLCTYSFKVRSSSCLGARESHSQISREPESLGTRLPHMHTCIQTFLQNCSCTCHQAADTSAPLQGQTQWAGTVLSSGP